jgi:hypothetical protein
VLANTGHRTLLRTSPGGPSLEPDSGRPLGGVLVIGCTLGVRTAARPPTILMPCLHAFHTFHPGGNRRLPSHHTARAPFFPANLHPRDTRDLDMYMGHACCVVVVSTPREFSPNSPNCLSPLHTTLSGLKNDPSRRCKYHARAHHSSRDHISLPEQLQHSVYALNPCTNTSL